MRPLPSSTCTPRPSPCRTFGVSSPSSLTLLPTTTHGGVSSFFLPSASICCRMTFSMTFPPWPHLIGAGWIASSCLGSTAPLPPTSSTKSRIAASEAPPPAPPGLPLRHSFSTTGRRGPSTSTPSSGPSSRATSPLWTTAATSRAWWTPSVISTSKSPTASSSSTSSSGSTRSSLPSTVTSGALVLFAPSWRPATICFLRSSRWCLLPRLRPRCCSLVSTLAPPLAPLHLPTSLPSVPTPGMGKGATTGGPPPSRSGTGAGVAVRNGSKAPAAGAQAPAPGTTQESRPSFWNPWFGIIQMYPGPW
nr:mucin-5AC-like [Setaria viridis]